MIEKNNISEEGIESQAIYSDSEEHRYVLKRAWNDQGKRMMFIGLNPSTATEIVNDPTITRVIGYAKREGFGSVSICNIFSFRATLPSDLKKSGDPIGKETDNLMIREAEDSDVILLGWGNHASFMDRGKKVRELLKPFKEKTFCLGLTKSAEPKHPLYLRKDAEFMKI